MFITCLHLSHRVDNIHRQKQVSLNLTSKTVISKDHSLVTSAPSTSHIVSPTSLLFYNKPHFSAPFRFNSSHPILLAFCCRETKMSFTATKFAPSPLPLSSTTPRSNDKPLSFSFDHSKANPSSSSFLGSTRKLLRFRAPAKPRSSSPVAAVLLQQTSNLVPFLLLSSFKNPCFLCMGIDSVTWVW